jgi:hypothetical protein
MFKTLRNYSSKPAAGAASQRGQKALVGRVEEVAGVCQGSDASGGRQQRAHGVDVEQDSQAPRAAAAHHNVSGGGQAASVSE